MESDGSMTIAYETAHNITTWRLMISTKLNSICLKVWLILSQHLFWP